MQRDVVVVWSDTKRKAYVSTNKQFMGKTKEEVREIWHDPHAHGGNRNREEVCEIVDAPDYRMEVKHNQGEVKSAKLREAKRRVSDDFRSRGYIVLNNDKI